MTSSPPPDAPHYNGRTLSPASPKPLHLPDVEQIPVLHNQIDPVFNLVSTHMDPSKALDQNDASHAVNASLDTLSGEHTTDKGYPMSEEAAGFIQAMYQGNGATENTNSNNVANDDVVHDQVQSTSYGDEYTSAPAQSNATDFAENQHADNDPSSTELASVQNSGPSIQPCSDATAAVNSESSKSPTQPLNLETGNIQALLDNLIASASSAPAGGPNALQPVANPSAAPQASSPSDSQTPISALPTVGLPARPPPQDEPAMHPNYAPGQNIRSYHNPIPPNTAQAPGVSQQAAPASPSNATGSIGFQSPPVASFQHAELPVQPIHESQQTPQINPAPVTEPPGVLMNNVQATQSDALQDEAYQEFLRAEAAYVAEGTWDRFPQGSRLFVGNLFTEKVSKRMIWDTFSRYGPIAQISSKNAYGFVQFVTPGASSQALVAEEGTELGGRKIHLEISKPQKNTRNANQNDRNRGNQGRRSRSPDYNRGSNVQRPGSGSYNNYGRRDRDDYRPMRSPSPRGARNFDRGMDRYYGGRRSRSRSPYGRRLNRSPSPRSREMDDEAALPIPRRNPVQVPEVQIIVVDESDRTFVAYIQQAFRDRGLRCDVQQLPRGVNLQTLIKRQIIEGVQAVVKIYRKSQVTGKIPLQVFDRSLGMADIRFDEYEELDATVAADVVTRAKAARPPSQSQPPTPQYPPQPSFNQPPQHSNHVPQHQPPFPPHIPPPNGPGAPNLAGLDPSTIQKLLSTLNQQQQQQQSPTNPSFPPPQDLATLLGSVARQTPQQQHQPQAGSPYPPPPNAGFPGFPPPPPQQQQQQGGGGYNPAALANNPALAQLLGRAQQQQGGGGSGYGGGSGQGQGQGYGGQQGGQGGGQNVQDIMAQLSKFGGGGGR